MAPLGGGRGREVVGVTLGLGLHEHRPAPPVEPDADGEPLFGTVTARPAARRVDGSIGASLLLHAAVILSVANLLASRPLPTPPPATVAAAPANRVFLPPPARLRQLAPAPPRRAEQQPRDRISIGPKSDQRAKELVLKRDDDLTRTVRGTTKEMTARPGPAQAAEEPSRTAERTTFPPPEMSPSTRGLSYAPSRRLDVKSSVERAIQASGGDWGEAAGSPQGVGALQFDPRGADFTRWVQHFKTEVYRNWTVPPSVSWGWGGRAGFEFVVDRAGRLVSLVDLASSGTASLDRAARNALESSTLLPLPTDYGPSTITMRVVFDYGPDRRAGNP